MVVVKAELAFKRDVGRETCLHRGGGCWRRSNGPQTTRSVARTGSLRFQRGEIAQHSQIRMVHERSDRPCRVGPAGKESLKRGLLARA